MRKHYYSEHPDLVSLKWGDLNEMLENVDIGNIEEIKPIKTSYNIVCDYTERNNNSPEHYQFKLNEINYDLNFSSCTIHQKTKILNNGYLSDIIDNNLINHRYFNCIEIELDYSSEIIENKTKTDISYLIEFIEIIWGLIEIFIEKYPNEKIFYVGKNFNNIKTAKYIKIFNKIFKNKYVLIEGDCESYKEGAMYFINKSIFK